MDCRATNEPPGRAARGLLTWAVDLWPYVNGKALTLRLDVKEMEASEMMDVIHYMFEEDNTYASAEEAYGKSAMRVGLYDMYGKPYRYKVDPPNDKKSGGRKYIDPMAGPEIDLDLPSETQEKKPYVPPTDFNAESTKPFGDILDSPIG